MSSPVAVPTPIVSTAIAAAAGGVTALWGMFGGTFEPVGFFLLVSGFALFAALARALASFQMVSWRRLTGRVMTALAATWMTCLVAWSTLDESPPLLAALAVASGLLGDDLAERIARRVLQWREGNGQH